jgi:hypothetical protein
VLQLLISPGQLLAFFRGVRSWDVRRHGQA